MGNADRSPGGGAVGRVGWSLIEGLRGKRSRRGEVSSDEQLCFAINVQRSPGGSRGGTGGRRPRRRAGRPRTYGRGDCGGGGDCGGCGWAYHGGAPPVQGQLKLGCMAWMRLVWS